jgi:hypothetical protein
MRKILLGTTAAVGVALLAPAAMAQEAPTVRVGGYFQFYYGHTTQSNPNTFNSVISQPAQVTQTSTGSIAIPSTGLASVKTGKNDLSSDAEIHIFVNGKAANGLSYGAVIELAFDVNEGSTTGAARRSFTAKTAGYIDEMYAFIASPTLGQLRVGDEDGPMGGLMNTGIVTNFGTGGIYGYWQNFTIRPNRTTTSPGDFGDNTKLIYLSPQFFGFDLGLSYAANSGTGQDTGCVNTSGASYGCDRTYAVTGATTNGIQSITDQPQRRNEMQIMGRWRGDLAGIGIATSLGYTTWSALRDMTAAGATATTLRPGQVYEAGLQLTAYGFTVGANYHWGQQNYFHGSLARGDKPMEQYTVGASWTAGPLTIGANSFWGSYAGTTGFTFNTTTGAYTRNANNTTASMRRYAYSAGATYRLAPGLDLIAEYTRHVIHEPGNNVAPTSNNQDKLTTDVIMVGTRLAF